MDGTRHGSRNFLNTLDEMLWQARTALVVALFRATSPSRRIEGFSEEHRHMTGLFLAVFTVLSVLCLVGVGLTGDNSDGWG